MTATKTNPAPTAPDDAKRSLARALDTIRQLKGRLADQDRWRQPVAVIGLGCRLPGGADTPKRFWRLLRAGTDAIADMPRDRLYGTDYLDPDPEKPGKAYVMRGGFIDNADQFDPELFGLSPREAAGMDPQQRIALETAWEALENAAIAPDSLQGHRMGVFMGVSTNDYVRLRQQFGDPRAIDAFQFYGETSFIPGRIAYTLGTSGPAVAIDTSCSSSLVAIHQACRSLKAGESDLALAGGVNLILSPYGYILVSKLHAVSPDGRCKTFDAAADGYGRGEGCVVLVLKRLADAVAAGDPILGVIHGTAVNHDGASSGITVPNIHAQEEVIRMALADAGIAPAAVGYVEAHGTGTDLGDPIEIRALDTVLGTGSGRSSPLLVGSVKTNIGHLEPVAGAAGLAKLLVSFQHGMLPPHATLARLNPKIDWDHVAVRVTAEATPWPADPQAPHAGVSSFGVTGTNAHAILGPAPERKRPERTVERPWQVLTVSGRSEAPRRQTAGRYERFIAENPDLPLADLCYTANTGRARLDYRFAAVADRPDTLRAQLAAFAARKLEPHTVEGVVPRGARPPLALLFPGQGSQHAGMGRELYATEPVFRAAIDRCDAILSPLLGRSLTELIFSTAPGAEALLEQTHHTQPAIFAVEYALSELWRHWGIRPAALLGHSFGEVAAACFADALDLGDAIRLVEARGRLAQALMPTGGDMYAINAGETDILAEIARLGCASLEIAAVNSPEDTVIAGDTEETQAIAGLFAGRGARVKRLPISHAFHTRATEPMLADFRAVVAGLAFRPPRLPIVASVTGAFHTADSLGDPDYWCRHTRHAVRFDDGLATLLEAGIEVFLEVGAHAVLTPMAGRHPGMENHAIIPSLRREEPEARAIRVAAATLFVTGVDPDWERVHEGDGALRVAIPTYAFQHDRYWFDPIPGGPATAEGGGDTADKTAPLLGKRIEAPDPTFEATLAPDDLLAQGGQEEDGIVVLPNLALAGLALEAAAALDLGALSLAIDTIAPALALRRQDDLRLRTQLTSDADGEWRIRCHALGRAEAATGGDWTPVLSARLTSGWPTRALAGPTLDEARRTCRAETTPTETLAGLGVAALRFGANEALADIGAPCATPAAAVAAALAATLDWPRPATLSGLDGFAARPGALTRARHLHVHVPARQPGQPVRADITLFDADGMVLARLDGARLEGGPDTDRLAGELALPDILHTLDWEERPRKADPTDRPGRALILADRGGMAQALALDLTALGWSTRLVGYAPASDNATAGMETVDPGSPAALRHVLETALADGNGPPTHLFFLWGLDLPRAGETALDTLALGRRLGTEPVVSLVQALAELRPATALRLWIATLGAQPVGVPPRPLQVTAAPLWGLGKSIALEHAEHWGGLIDLDPNDPQAHRALIDEVTHPDIEDLLGFRNGRRHVQRLNPCPPGRLPKRPIRPARDGWHLVTGGMGGIGLALARWLAAHGAGGIAITGRRPLAGDAAAALADLRATGAKIRYVQADACARADMAALVAELSADGGLRGVIHAAGLSRPQDLVQADPETFATVMRPKIEGAWLLHELTADLELDFFALFSTIACVWGSQHVASYAAANQFLDSLAHHRRALGLPALAVNWGLWATGSHLFDEEVLRFLKSVGLHRMPARQNIDTLMRLLAGDRTQMVVAGADWHRFKPLLEARGPRPLLEAIDVRTRVGPEPHAVSDILDRLAQADPADTLKLVDGYVWEQYARLLGVDVGRIRAKLEDGGSLMDFGLDSLLVMEMVARCRKDLRLEIKARDFLQCPGLQWPDFLVSALAEQHRDAAPLRAAAG